MFAVIFKATPGIQDKQYSETVSTMRKLAFKKYGCLDFIAATEGDQEIAISYWPSEEAIRQWKNDPEHALTQQQGQQKWYKNYSVQVVEVKREYKFNR